MKDFAAIDFETANGKRTSVCSVGIVIVKGGRIVNKIYRLIRPAPNYYTQWTTAIHGLTYDDTMEADDFPESMGGNQAVAGRTSACSSQ